MGSDHEAEIRASVGAHHDLGPGYDDAVAEGLVERIGAEIDKRIEAQLRRYGPGYPGYPGPGYPGYPGYQAPLLPPAYPPPVPGTRSSTRPAGQRSVAMTVIALGSMTLGVVATAIVAHARSGGGQAVMVLLIWAAIVTVNIAYARRC
jgi:hypothetical protein